MGNMGIYMEILTISSSNYNTSSSLSPNEKFQQSFISSTHYEFSKEGGTLREWSIPELSSTELKPGLSISDKAAIVAITTASGLLAMIGIVVGLIILSSPNWWLFVIPAIGPLISGLLSLKSHK